LCKIYIYFSFLSATVSPSVLILASIDRLLISSQNVNTRLYSSKRLAYFSISISIFFWIIFNVHILIKANIQQFGPSNFVCYYDLSKSYIDFIFYSLLIIHICFGVFMIILSILSFKNVHHIQAIPRQQRKQIRSMNKKDFQLLRCLFVQGIVFISFSLLINFFYVYQAATRDQEQTLLEQAIGNFLNNVFTILYDIPYCVNFFIFMIVSKAFRHEMKRTAYKMCGKDLIVPRECENIELNIAVVNSIVLSN
jgi:hypothetical protein